MGGKIGNNVFDIVCESTEFISGSQLANNDSHVMVLVNDSLLVITLLEDNDQFLILVCSYGCPGKQSWCLRVFKGAGI